VNVEQRVGHYVMLRDWVREQDKAHKEKTAAAKAEMELIEGQLFEFMKENGLDNSKTAAGTFYKTKKYTASINDSTEFMRFVIGGELWDLIDKKANALALVEFATENGGKLPPGVTVVSIEGVNVNRPK
jgi:hypothetical protein